MDMRHSFLKLVKERAAEETTRDTTPATQQQDGESFTPTAFDLIAHLKQRQPTRLCGYD